MERKGLAARLNAGIGRIVREALAITARNPRERMFLARFAFRAWLDGRSRLASAARGRHVPPFLIASITDRCNLQCAGCYARARSDFGKTGGPDPLSASEWGRIFREAHELGVSFVLLAGGEPLVRDDVLDEAAKHTSLVFPVFTNGTLLQGRYLDFFDRHRHLIPILSLEGNEAVTDTRRGMGVHASVGFAMAAMRKRNIFFGASVTVTRDNLAEVTDDAFIGDLCVRGCRIVFYVEYVPVDGVSLNALSSSDRGRLAERITELRARKEPILFVSFPGDEDALGGCLAAGRGFFHISARGFAEACPFSPYSDVNLGKVPLSAALDSPLFAALRERGFLESTHDGGCALFAHDAETRDLEERLREGTYENEKA